ncbi:ATP-binding cassette domain-containing protein [Streptomyces sp. NPDC058394]|uniref:ATP-binding cassette domain-containing protein n=1 Tax=Streptomyces sp. NPDC058394 TaxID=3346477 RepID=UPI00365AE6CC
MRGASAPTAGERGTVRRLLTPARRFVRERRATLLKLAALSVVESVQTFLGGFCVARALDDGFLRGDTARGLVWLSVAAVVILLGAPVVRGVFARLADLTEPLRDGLVRRAVVGALRGATAAGRVSDGSAVSRLTSQTEIARDSFAGLVLTARSFVFVAVGAIGGLLSLAPQFLLVVLPPLLVGIALFAASLKPMARAQHRYLDADEAIGRRGQDVRTALRDIVACGTQATAAAKGEQLFEEAATAASTMARWAAVRTLALAVAGQLPVFLLLAATPWLMDQGVTAGALVGALTYLLQALLPALHALMTVLGAAVARLFVILERLLRPLPDDGPPPLPHDVPAPAPATPGVRPAGAAAVELRSVRVAFGARAHPVLDGLCLTVGDGEHLAVVGPSGIGKSTLLQVAAGLLTPHPGEVYLAGRQVGRCDAADLPALRTLLPQEAYVFTGSLRDNLRYLRPHAPDADIAEAVRALAMEPLVARVGGLDAAMVPQELSQGERQLVALCRAYLSPAPVLLLDEATCHLDPSAEAEAEQALASRPGTLVVVAHRLSSALRADRVLVLDGTDAVCGTHEELLVRSPLYRDLVGHWHDESR